MKQYVCVRYISDDYNLSNDKKKCILYVLKSERNYWLKDGKCNGKLKQKFNNKILYQK